LPSDDWGQSVAGRSGMAWSIFFSASAFRGGDTIINIIELRIILGLVPICYIKFTSNTRCIIIYKIAVQHDAMYSNIHLLLTYSSLFSGQVKNEIKLAQGFAESEGICHDAVTQEQ